MTPYNGGKSGSGTYQQIINHIPPHNIYIEPFAGHCGIFRKIRRAAISILNDIDTAVAQEIFDFFKKDNSIDVNAHLMQGTLFEKPIKPIVIVCRNDYSAILDRFKENADAFIYCDPPYPMDTRASQERLYTFDWEAPEHHHLFLEACSNCKCAVMISSYPNNKYNQALKDWRQHTFYSYTRSHRKVQEIIYMNYPPPVVLHDFQYLGKNYRQRENIKQKTKRHCNRLDRMPEIERTAIVSAIIQKYKETAETLIKL